MKQENEDIARKMQYILNMRPVFNKEALFSDGTRYYRNPTEPKSGEKVIIMWMRYISYPEIRNIK